VNYVDFKMNGATVKTCLSRTESSKVFVLFSHKY